MSAAAYVEKRLETIQKRHNFDPNRGAKQVRHMPPDVVAAFREFRALLAVADHMPHGAKTRIRVAHDPAGLTPLAHRTKLRERPVHVYFARKDGTTFWKIGSSICPRNRVRAIQTGNDGSLHLSYVIDAGGRSLEGRLKRALARNKTRDRHDALKGEWFSLPPTYVLRLVRHLRATPARIDIPPAPVPRTRSY